MEFDYKNVESIAKAIGAAAQVVVTIGPTEDGPKSNVSFEDASNVIDAAKLANITNLVVKHHIYKIYLYDALIALYKLL